jgi:hypothetical protein
MAVIAAALLTSPVPADDLADSLPALQQLGKEGAGHAQAMAAWQVVAAASADQLPIVLAAMQNDNPLADNWIRAAVDTIAERSIRAGKPLPRAALEEYLADRSHSARSRRLAFEWLTQVDPALRVRWIPQLLNDPSLELRREAVAKELERGHAAETIDQLDEAVAAYNTALTHARDPDQIDTAYNALRKLDQPVDLLKHFGWVRTWHVIGPFDNTDMGGFDREYPPEETIDLGAQHLGKEQIVKWAEAVTDDDYGKLDLNAAIGKNMGAAAYAVAFFHADEAREADLRLSSLNANKVWLNGELLTANHVYHAGESIDQYIGKGGLKAGRNTILLKICQNEQTESWAQDWAFQLRVCDALGTAILPTDVD